jgi:hypothetical protein
MGSFAFAAYAASYLPLGVFLWHILKRDGWRFSVTGLILCLLIPGLIYENAVLAMGSAIGTGGALEQLNRMRFVLHALFGGGLTLVAVDVGQRLGVRWLGHVAVGVAWGIATFIALYSTPFYVGAAMESVMLGGVTRYVTIGSSPLGPLPVIGGTVLCLAIGVLVWRRLKTPLLFIGALAVLVGHAGPSEVVFFTGNLSEIVFILSLLIVEWRLRRYAPQQQRYPTPRWSQARG